MDHFNMRNGEVYCEDVPLRRIAEEVGTPTYVYSSATLDRHIRVMQDAFAAWPTLICYAVKANSNLGVLGRVFQAGCGADLVSGGELLRSLKAGVAPEKVVFSGIGKTRDEIALGLEAGILAFNVESAFELEHIREVAVAKNLVAPINLRINPDVDARTHPKIATGMYSSKFGIVADEARRLAALIRDDPALRLRGLACHIGSQMTSLGPLAEAADYMVGFVKELQADGHEPEVLDMGGGLGIRYQEENPPLPEDYAATLIDRVRTSGLKLIIEPGRVVVGNAGVLLNRVLGVKTTPHKKFVVVDGAMNDLLRPGMYDSWHDILPVRPGNSAPARVDVVGPICESTDFFGKDRSIPLPEAGDLLYVRSCGAYGSTMSSNYNSRPRTAEVLVEGDTYRVVRRREKPEELWALESES